MKTRKFDTRLVRKDIKSVMAFIRFVCFVVLLLLVSTYSCIPIVTSLPLDSFIESKDVLSAAHAILTTILSLAMIYFALFLVDLLFKAEERYFGETVVMDGLKRKFYKFITGVDYE